MNTPMTPRQAEVLAFMRSFQAKNDNMPTNQTLARHFGWTSTNAAHEHIAALVRAGELERLQIQGSYRFKRRPECANAPPASTTP